MDLKTVLIITPMISLTLSAFFVFLSFENKGTNKGILIMSISYFIALLSNVAILLRTYTPQTSYLLTNTFGFVGMFMLYLGVYRYLNKKAAPRTWGVPLLGLMVIVSAYFVYIKDIYYIRAVMWSAYMTLYLVMTFIEVLKAQSLDYMKKHYYPALIVIVLYVLANIYRILNSLVLREYVSFTNQGTYESYAITASVFMHLLLGLSLTIIIHRQNIRVLENAYGKTKKKFHKIIEDSHTDFLTGAFNRKKIDKQLTAYINLAKKSEFVFSALFVDIDDFKLINDRHGHLVGDRVLRNISNLLDRTLENPASYGRWGGDEFLVLLPNLNYEQAIEYRDTVHNSIKGTLIKGENITLSIGVAEYNKKFTEKDLFNRLDEDMYKNKKG